MKIAEALQERSDLNRRIEELESRLTSNVLVQEGTDPNEAPGELFREMNECYARLEYLIARINLTNSQTVCEGKTLTEMIARREILSRRIASYREVLEEASQNTYRAARTEIRILSTIDVKSFRKEADRMSRDLRELDNRIQQINWDTELL